MAVVGNFGVISDKFNVAKSTVILLGFTAISTTTCTITATYTAATITNINGNNNTDN
jgi:hypothetical protein